MKSMSLPLLPVCVQSVFRPQVVTPINRTSGSNYGPLTSYTKCIWLEFRTDYLSPGRHAVPQLVEALRYKLAGSGFDSRRCQGNFSLTQFFRPHYGPGDGSASKRNKYQKYILGVKAADCLEIWEPQLPQKSSGPVQACNKIVLTLPESWLRVFSFGFMVLLQ